MVKAGGLMLRMKVIKDFNETFKMKVTEREMSDEELLSSEMEVEDDFVDVDCESEAEVDGACGRGM